MEINKHLDSTYLKTAEQAGISEAETVAKVKALVSECITNDFVLAMIRPEYVSLAQKMIQDAGAKVLVGTVIGFHEGTASTEAKLAEAQQAIADGADELDFVVNYKAFQEGKVNLVKSEVYKGTKLALDNGKKVKWIIEVAALTDEEIAQLSVLIKEVTISNFGEENAANVFVKSSTGFFKTADGKPNGATFEAMKIIKEHASPLAIKAAGGVRSYEDAVKMVEMGVERIGTSSAKKIFDGKTAAGSY